VLTRSFTSIVCMGAAWQGRETTTSPDDNGARGGS